MNSRDDSQGASAVDEVHPYVRLARAGLWLALGIVGFLFVLAVLYFVRGSLEEFPTAEKTSAIRWVSAMGAVLLLGVELGLWSLLRHATRDPRERAVDGRSVDRVKG
jgi:hypothetical protein